MSLARILGKPRGRQSFISDSRWVLPASLIGLEHEYEGVKDPNLPKQHTLADFWAYHEEGSLKDHGAEYVFATPLFGVDAYNALDWLVSYAKEAGWKCTKRTGIHVHLDVRDLTVPQLAGLCIIYAALEPILYHWVGDGRDSSHFCIPLYRADEALLGACSIISSAFKDEKEDGHVALGLAEEFQRYAGFNLQALHKFGSIEFRQLQTTHDLVRITDWVNIVMSLKATALKLPQSDGAVVRMIQRMGARELLHYVFPPQLAVKLYTPKSEEEFVTRGLVSARDIAVHGCGTDSWIKKDFPKGEHKGFVKWIKGAKELKKGESAEEFRIEEDDDYVGFDEEAEIPVEAVQPRNQLLFDPPQAGVVEVPIWRQAENRHMVFQDYFAAPQPEPPQAAPPVAPPLPVHAMDAIEVNQAYEDMINRGRIVQDRLLRMRPAHAPPPVRRPARPR